ncbi:hypothetical protein FH972_024080 [Carpinus fangiana]|uniref:Protein kinase domain-containing protein n=1 Tax=Carpinus fangiana TaxID=176857 RepID=A0A5N6KXH3_9ROSI|nr:hypothetical protein FH972_024080 [Carpinus fangiana]
MHLTGLCNQLWTLLSLSVVRKSPSSVPLGEPKFVAEGGAGEIFELSSTIVVKVYFDRDGDQARNEKTFFCTVLKRKPLHENVVRCFHCTTQLLFLENVSGGSLEKRLRQNQTRWIRPVQVAKLEDQGLACRWMVELCRGIAWLEDLGYAHGDIRPDNLLLDRQDHLKVADFGSITALGSPIDAGQPLYSRVLGPEAGKAAGTFGNHGPRSEQFAIGSVLFYITRGHALFDDKDLDAKKHGRIAAAYLQAKRFPPLDDREAIDAEIQNCWHGKYESIQALSRHIAALAPIKAVRTSTSSRRWLQAQEDLCKEIAKTGRMNRLIESVASSNQ